MEAFKVLTDYEIDKLCLKLDKMSKNDNEINQFYSLIDYIIDYKNGKVCLNLFIYIYIY